MPEIDSGFRENNLRMRRPCVAERATARRLLPKRNQRTQLSGITFRISPYGSLLFDTSLRRPSNLLANPALCKEEG
jgi:hypothetical protein